MSVLRPTPVSTDRFTYLKDEHLLVAEISDLGRGFAFGRVYDDACDEGLTLVSHRTGRTAPYAVDRVDRDGDGELMGWTLLPARVRDADLPLVQIIND